MDFGLDLLERITNNFSEDLKVGSDVYGDVYKAVYLGKEIALKKLHPLERIDDKKFQSEVLDRLAKIFHKNIVQFIGYGNVSSHKFLSYNLCFEYVPGGGLENHIADGSCELDWPTCYNIIRGTCEGLNYLHSFPENPIFHFDLKPANILLDKTMTPKIANVGLSGFYASSKKDGIQIFNERLGYIPPEYYDHRLKSKKCDVFSFGIIIVKMVAGITGCIVCFEMSPKDFMRLVTEDWTKRLQAMPGLYSSHELDIRRVNTCAGIALRCIHMDQEARPRIQDIVQELEELEAAILVRQEDARNAHEAEYIRCTQNLEKLHEKVDRMTNDKLLREVEIHKEKELYERETKRAKQELELANTIRDNEALEHEKTKMSKEKFERISLMLERKMKELELSVQRLEHDQHKSKEDLKLANTERVQEASKHENTKMAKEKLECRVQMFEREKKELELVVQQLEQNIVNFEEELELASTERDEEKSEHATTKMAKKNLEQRVQMLENEKKGLVLGVQRLEEIKGKCEEELEHANTIRDKEASEHANTKMSKEKLECRVQMLESNNNELELGVQRLQENRDKFEEELVLANTMKEEETLEHVNTKIAKEKLEQRVEMLESEKKRLELGVQRLAQNKDIFDNELELRVEMLENNKCKCEKEELELRVQMLEQNTENCEELELRVHVLEQSNHNYEMEELERQRRRRVLYFYFDRK